MKFYVTSEGIQKLRRSFLNLKLFSLIDVQEIIEGYGYTYDTMGDYGAFIVNDVINNMIKNYSRSKRIRGIIYINANMNEDVIANLRENLETNDKITEFVLIDEYNLPKLQSLYHLFNEIIFFPSIKKIRLIEASPIKEFVRFKM